MSLTIDALHTILPPDADEPTVHRVIAQLHCENRIADANEALEEWLGSHMTRNEHIAATHIIEGLPEAWVCPRVKALYWMSVRQGGESPEKSLKAKQAAEQAYLSGDRNPRLMYFLADDRQLDGHDELALQVMRESLATDMSGQDRMRMMHIYVSTLDDMQSREALEPARELLALAQQAGSMRHVGLAEYMIGCALLREGDTSAWEAHAMRAIGVFRRSADWPQLLVHLNNVAQDMTDMGRPVEAGRLLAEAWALPDLSSRHRAWLSLSELNLRHQYGEHAAALSWGEKATQAAKDAAMLRYAINTNTLWAERLAFDGQHELSQQRLRDALAHIAENNRFQSQWNFSSGVVAFSAGDMAQAARHFETLRGQEAELVQWDASRLELYRLALALRTGHGLPDVAALETALAANLNDYPLLTDASQMRDTLAWLREQPGWSSRLDAVFAEKPSGTVPLRLELFGPLEIHTNQGRLRLPLSRSGELLAYMALHGPSTRGELLGTLLDGQSGRAAADHLKKIIKGLREGLTPLLPDGVDPLVNENRRYSLSPLLQPSVSWLPEGLFPAPGVRRSGPIEVRGAFLADARGEWVSDVRDRVHEALREQLRQAVAGGDLQAQQPLQVAMGLE